MNIFSIRKKNVTDVTQTLSPLTIEVANTNETTTQRIIKRYSIKKEDFKITLCPKLHARMGYLFFGLSIIAFGDHFHTGKDKPLLEGVAYAGASLSNLTAAVYVSQLRDKDNQ